MQAATLPSASTLCLWRPLVGIFVRRFLLGADAHIAMLMTDDVPPSHRHTPPAGAGRAALETHSTLLMMIMVILVPQTLGFCSSLWSSCYKARQNDPRPSLIAMFWILIGALFESSGMSLFVLVVAPRINAVLILTCMNGVFVLPALQRCLNIGTLKWHGSGWAEQTIGKSRNHKEPPFLPSICSRTLDGLLRPALERVRFLGLGGGGRAKQPLGDLSEP